MRVAGRETGPSRGDVGETVSPRGAPHCSRNPRRPPWPAHCCPADAASAQVPTDARGADRVPAAASGETPVPDRPGFTAEPASSRKRGGCNTGSPALVRRATGTGSSLLHAGSLSPRGHGPFSLPTWTRSLQTDCPHTLDKPREAHMVHSHARLPRETGRQVRRPSRRCRDATFPSETTARPDSGEGHPASRGPALPPRPPGPLVFKQQPRYRANNLLQTPTHPKGLSAGHSDWKPRRRSGSA